MTYSTKLRLLTALLALGATSTAYSLDTHQVAPNYQLNSQCPPGFGLESGNRCVLHTLYHMYSSIQGRGVGGTKTSLPHYRDGFTPQQIDLGRLLFFDPVLSSNAQISCASCHHPNKAFTDGLSQSRGVGGRQGLRSAPTLWNTAFLTHFNWDASANSFEQQAQIPLFSSAEMNNTPENLLSSLKAITGYQKLFRTAFADNIKLAHVYTALAAFQSSLISLNSRYDEYAHGNHSALTQQELAGLNVFRSFVARCSECHTPPLFTNNQIAVIGAPNGEGLPFDLGAETTFNSRKLRGGFKVPTLRNIDKTAPYMHHGVFATLRDATQFYNKGRGHATDKGNQLYLHWHITDPNLHEHEIDQLLAFMNALRDEKFMPVIPHEVPSGVDPRLSFATEAGSR